MKKLFLIPLLSFALLSGCTNEPKESINYSSKEDSSIVDSSKETTSSETSSSSSSSTSSSTEEKLNPMNDPLIGRQYYLNHIGDIYSTWNTYRGKGITIAVIDVGFNPNHEDFLYKDGTSKVLDKSASFVTNGNTTTTSVGVDKVVNMGESHGTFCAGVAAAAINGKGVVGIAPEASLLLLKADLKPKSIAKAFKYAADNGARVITISIGSYYDYTGDLVNDGSDLGTVFDEPVKYCYDKGIVVCSAGGNGGEDHHETEYTFPGCVDHVIGVGGLAANSSSEIWSGSSYNSSEQYRFIDVLAPANDMFGCCHYSGKTHDGGWNGTSFASPIVAGMAALYFEKYPSKTARDFENDLYSSSHKIITSKIARSDQLGNGRVDVGKLLGTSGTSSVKVKIKSSWSSSYIYVWNSISGKAKNAWPGTAVSPSNGVFTLDVNLKDYDSIIFTNTNSGPQTVDLLASSFLFNNTYDLNNAVQENSCLVGKYI